MADVASTFASWSSITNNNSPAGTATVGNGADDNFREVQGAVVRGLSHKGADIASAATTDIGAIEGYFHDITGTTTITSFGTVRAGISKILRPRGNQTWTNSSDLICPGGANLLTADGDIACVFSLGSGSWIITSYEHQTAGFVPIGAVMPFAGDTAPSGWLFCYGQAVSRAVYARLFTAISTTYGTGDGSSTFNLPDMRGRVIAGQDDMGGTSANRLTGVSGSLDADTLGAAGGAETVTLTTAHLPASGLSIPSLSVSGTFTGHSGNGGAITTALVSAGVAADTSTSSVVSGSTGTGTTGVMGSGGAHPVVQPTIALNYVIKT
jgi:microcystin-dependent protein